MPSDARKYLYRQPGTGIWYVDVRADSGSETSLSLDTTDFDLACRRLDRHVAPARSPPVYQSTSPDPDRTEISPGSVEWALAEYLHRAEPDLAVETRGAYRNQAGHVVRIIGGLPLRELRRHYIDAYVAQRTSEHAGAETRRKELVLLRAAVRKVRGLGADAGEPDGLLFPRLKSAYVPRDRWLTVEQYQQVFAALAPSRQLQLLVACYTGARRAELMRMRWEHIDWQRGEITIAQTKPVNSRRRVPLDADLKAVLFELRQPTGPLLGTFNNFYRAVAVACKKVGLARFSFNDCRRTFASWMLQGGAPLFDVSKLLGHRSIAMVQKVYGHLSDDSLRRAVEKLPSSQREVPAKATKAS